MVKALAGLAAFIFLGYITMGVLGSVQNAVASFQDQAQVQYETITKVKR